MSLRRIVSNAALFATPFLVWIVVVVVVDPFNYFNISHVVAEPIKKENAASLNEMMYNMLDEVHNPGENLIIGDSRVESFSLPQIKEITGLQYHRLSSNALKLNEAVDLFWFANRRKRIARVVFGINFNQYNEYAFADRVHSVEAVIHNPLLYVFDRSVAQACYYVTKAALTGRPAFSSIPPMTPDEFWNYIVTVRATEWYAKYRHPDELYGRMRDMVTFAKNQGTDVSFVIVPHHVDFQQRVQDFGLSEESARFRRELNGLGVRVIDYDYPNAVTAEKSNFRDPLHCNSAVASMIVNEVFGGKTTLGRLSHSSSANLASGPVSPVH